MSLGDLYIIDSADPELQPRLVESVRGLRVHELAAGATIELEGPAGKSMVLPEDLSNDLVLLATATGTSTFRGFLRRLFADEGSPEAAAFSGQVLLLAGGYDEASIAYAEEFRQLAERAGPSRLRVELALGGARVDDGSETTLPDKIATLAPLIREKIEGGANVYLGGLRGMVKPVEKALNAVSPIPLKDLKKAKKYASEVY